MELQNQLPVYLMDRGSMISMDHCYSKPWSAHPDASNARPAKKIYMVKPPHLTQAMVQNRYFFFNSNLFSQQLYRQWLKSF